MNLAEGLDAFYAELHKPQGTRPGLFGGTWRRPLKSDALAVHPRQVKEAMEDAAKKGVPTEFDARGSPIFTSARHRKKYCVAYGYFDKSAGYADAGPGSFRGELPPRPDVMQEFGEAVAALARRADSR